MPANKKILPDSGNVDGLGSEQKPWAEGWFQTLYVNGQPVLVLPMDASAIQSGLLDPNRIASLLTSVILAGVIPNRSLAAISADAAIGASDPVGRINAGATLIQGNKVALNSLDPNSLNIAIALAQLLVLATGGGLATDDFSAGVAGLKIAKGVFDVNLGSFGGTLRGLINIASRFKVDAAGNLVIGDAVANPTQLHGIDANGREWWGSDAYISAPVQIDESGNVFIADTPQSLSVIDLGSIRAINRGVQPSQAGGQFSGILTLTPLTRGSDIYYTTNGSDPSDVTNAARVKYTVPFAVTLGPGGTQTVKAVAIKLGVASAVQTWVFTGDPNTVAAPTATPLPGPYYQKATTMAVTLASGTAGATMKYTTDGTDPGPANGTVYTGPINIPRGPTTIKAQATKAGLTPSAIASFAYTLSKGGGDGGGTGGGGGGGGILP